VMRAVEGLKDKNTSQISIKTVEQFLYFFRRFVPSLSSYHKKIIVTKNVLDELLYRLFSIKLLILARCKIYSTNKERDKEIKQIKSETNYCFVLYYPTCLKVAGNEGTSQH